MIFFTVPFVFDVQAQSPAAAKLKPPSLRIDDLVVDNVVFCEVLFFKPKSLSSPF